MAGTKRFDWQNAAGGEDTVYRKCAWFADECGTGQAEICVLPVRVASLPIAVSIDLVRLDGARRHLSGSLRAPDEAPQLRDRLQGALRRAGWPPDASAAYAQEIARFVESEKEPLAAAVRRVDEEQIAF